MDLYVDDTVHIYSCGPNPMLRSLHELLKGRQIACEVSLEERMACGSRGLSRVCCENKSGGVSDGPARVCKEGPVFDINSVDFGDDSG